MFHLKKVKKNIGLTSLYTPYKADADALLTAEGFADVIVSE